jgi:hypothetical protein
MRPDRFQTLMREHLSTVPGITKVDTFEEAGHDRSRYGLVVHHHNGAETWWQIVAISRTGDDYSQPEAGPEIAERQAELSIPDLTGSRVDTARVEEAIAAVFTHADGGEAAHVERYSTRDPRGAITHGLTIDFHDASRIFVYGLASPRQGERPQENRYYQMDATV